MYCPCILARQDVCLLCAILSPTHAREKDFLLHRRFFSRASAYLARSNGNILCDVRETVQVIIILLADCKPFGSFLQFMQGGLV